VAGALFVSTEELRSGRGDVADQRALAVAEWALAQAVAAWDPERNTGDPIGRTAVLGESSWTPNDRVVVTGARVQRRSVWLVAEATVGGDGRVARARHAVAASLRLVGVGVPERAALTARGAVTVNRGTVDGRGTGVPRDASGVCADDDAGEAAGVIVPPAAGVRCVDCDALAGLGVFGAPPVDSSGAGGIDSVAARALGALAVRATIQLAGGSLAPRPSVDNGACDRADPLNWGDPSGTSVCVDYYPVVHVRGDATLGAGSQGQGILLVDGNLRVEATARFAGVVRVSGDISVVGMGAEIVGAAFADDGGGPGTSLVADGGAVRFSRCAVHRATLGSARLARTPVRWWTELR